VGTKAVPHLDYYDARGGMTTQIAEARPDTPVVVLAVNERVAPLEQAEPVAAPQPIAADGDIMSTQGALVAAGNCNQTCAAGSTTCRNVYLKRLKISTASEPWYKGDPEIYVYCTIVGESLTDIHHACAEHDSPGVNDTSTWYVTCSAAEAIYSGCNPTTGDRLVKGLNQGQGLQCYLMERDEGLTHPVDADDVLGSASIYFDDGARTYYLEKGALEMR
jgi:hypothetical protein